MKTVTIYRKYAPDMGAAEFSIFDDSVEKDEVQLYAYRGDGTQDGVCLKFSAAEIFAALTELGFTI